jgi:hypothetical protein
MGPYRALHQDPCVIGAQEGRSLQETQGALDLPRMSERSQVSTDTPARVLGMDEAPALIVGQRGHDSVSGR